MKITINIKPKRMTVVTVDNLGFGTKVVRSTKSTIVSHVVSNRHLTYSSDIGAGYVIGYNNKPDTIRVFNLEKRRPVVKIVTDKKLLKKGIKRQVVTPGHWVAHVYDFPVDVLRATGMKVLQGTRTFKLVKA
jgi:hypothetical protein